MEQRKMAENKIQDVEFKKQVNLRFSAYTWNVGEIEPISDRSIIDLFKLNKDGAVDLIMVGLQEIQTGVRETVKSFVYYDEWIKAFKEVFAKFDYYMIENVRVQGVTLGVFAKLCHLPYIRFVMTDIERTGVASTFGNKGGVVVSANIYGQRICFLNTHLAAHLHNDKERIADFNEIKKEIDFGGKSSIFNHDVVFWIGDTNFRLDDISRDDVISSVNKKDYESLWKFDQLKKYQKTNEDLKQFTEGQLLFPPTYKAILLFYFIRINLHRDVFIETGQFDPNTDVYDTSEKQRKPAWTDRILWRIHPENKCVDNTDISVELIDKSYTNIEWLRSSDHRPVTCSFNIKIKKVDMEPLLTLEVKGAWNKEGDGRVNIKYRSGMEWDNSDYLAIYPANMEDYHNHEGWVYVPENLKKDIGFPSNQIPEAGQYRIGYYSKNTTSLVALSNVFEIKN